MTTTADKKDTGGTPPHYNLEQVYDAIHSLLEDGRTHEEIDAATVKTVLCEQYGITNEIDVRSLQGTVYDVLDSIAEEEEGELIGLLPQATLSSIDSIFCSMKLELQLLVARQYADCVAKAYKECDELRRDNTNANWRIKELETKIHDQARQIQGISKLSEKK